MSGLLHQITIQYHLDQPPDQARKEWKQSPPEWMKDFELLDESYNGLSYRADVTSLWQRIVFLGMGNTYYPLSLAFDSDGSTGSKVTITGQATDKVAAAIRQDAAAHGGGVDPRVGAPN